MAGDFVVVFGDVEVVDDVVLLIESIKILSFSRAVNDSTFWINEKLVRLTISRILLVKKKRNKWILKQ